MGAFFIHKNLRREKRKNPKEKFYMSKKWLTYDIQFFADGDAGSEGAEEAADAEQSEVDENTEGEESEGEDGEESEQEEDRDAIYAAARRRAESEAQAKYAKEQSARDQYFANLCKGRVNPETNQPIRSEAEYIEALQAQQRVNATAQLTEKGIDPSLIENLLATNPTLMEAQRVIQEQQQKDAQAKVQEDIDNILKLDKTYANTDELINSDEFQKAVQMCQNTPNLRLTDAYKIVNFDALRGAGIKAAKQAAINESRNKSHLSSTPNTPTGKGNVEIPEAEINKWQRMFPDKSRKDLNALYAKVHSKK
jgi:hypothetical protein